jgi:hypothetical protein
MPHVREPVVHPVAIKALRPTQMTVGLREVEAKRASWRARGSRSGEDYLGQHLIPVILGPKERRYLIDHHHLARALLEEGVENILVTVVANLSHLDRDGFWFAMDMHQWAHPYDAHGHRRSHEDLPKTVKGLADDPFRSLAGELRLAGGFAKDTTPFSEFLWADFLRRRLARKLVDRDFEAALAEATALAHSQDATYLPGWSGASPR